MPLPTPEPDEEHTDFVERCMGDKTMVDEFDDPGQRRAVCERQWENGQGEGAMNNRYHRVVRFVQEHPWAILPTTLAALVEILRSRMEGRLLSEEEIRARIGAASRPTPRVSGSIAVLPLFGVIAHRMNMMTDVSGGTSTEKFGATFQQAIADPDIAAVILDVDSPGGSVFGVDELASMIFSARGTKLIVASANSLAASAAYWIASQADEIVVTPSGEVGSIGVLAVHEDMSKQTEMVGVKMSFISAGRFKTEGNPFEPLGEEARAYLQGRVDDYYDALVKAVARGRGVAQRDVRGGFGEGRLVGAAEALKLGMVDNVETLDQTIVRLSGRRAGSGAARAESEPVEIAATAQALPQEAETDLELRRRRLRLAELA